MQQKPTNSPKFNSPTSSISVPEQRYFAAKTYMDMPSYRANFTTLGLKTSEIWPGNRCNFKRS